LTDVKGISEAKVHKIKEIVKQMVPMDFKTAADALQDRQYVSKALLCLGWNELFSGSKYGMKFCDTHSTSFPSVL